VESATCIRAAQLRAIEDDRFDDLPAETYARGFVRTYAEQLGLEPEVVVDRFNRQWSDTHQAADADAPAPFERRRVPVDVSRRPPGPAALAAAVLLLLVSLAVVVVRSQGGGSAGAAPRHAPPATAAQAPSSSSPATSNTPPPVPAGVRLTLLATPGACWFEARRGSATGPLLAERTLASGQAVHLHGRRLWLRVGDAGSARLRMNGRPVPLAAVAGPVNLLVSPGKVTRL
jgi:cytoskeleton protein RodZ